MRHDRERLQRRVALRCAILVTAGLWLPSQVCKAGPEDEGSSSAPTLAATVALPRLIGETYVPPSSVRHTLRDGESLWDVARAYGLSTDEIMRQNNLSPERVRSLRPGLSLRLTGVKRIPEEGEELRPRTTSSAPRAASAAGAAGRTGATHVLAPGETLWDIAKKYGMSVAALMAANGLTEASVQKLREGRELFLAAVQGRPDTSAPKTKPERQRRADEGARKLGLGSLVTAGKLLHGRPEARWVAAAGGGKGLGGTLRWPVAQGWFVRGFGSGQGGYHKAMDIMGKTGWNVRAAAGGIVGYSGNAVPGFGNMVMLVHPGGWVTLYAHNSVNFVHAGQRVQRGDVLAQVGSTGRSTGPHVHFELIYNGQNCDPAPLFRPGVRHRNGKFSKLQYTSWLKPEQRPKNVQCAVRQKHPPSVLSEDPLRDAQHVDDRDLFTPTSDADFSKLMHELSGPDSDDLAPAPDLDEPEAAPSP